MRTVRRLVGHRSLSGQILAIQTAVLVLTLVAGFLLAVWYQEGQLDRQYEQRALGMAERRRISFPLPRPAGRVFTHNEFVLVSERQLTGRP